MKPEVPPLDGTRRYAVFLSYRHADNKEPGRQWATWLHQMLENYEIPCDLVGSANNSGDVIPASLYPVFRDEEELPADADLTRNIRKALENSGLLIVVCSPRAVQSRFVAEEIRYFKELGKADRILALMIDGEPNASEDSAKQRSGLTAEMECLPEPLRRGVAKSDGSIDWNARTEPIAADARPNGRPVQGWTNSAAYREQLLHDQHSEKSNIDSEVKSYEQRLELTKLKIVAGALGVPLGVLTQRDKAMQLERARKRAHGLRRWLAVVAVLAMIAIAGGIFAWKKQQEAAQARDVTERARAEEENQRKLAQEQSERRRQMLAEAARSDRLAAEEKLENERPSDAFAYLARSITYDGTTTLAAEKAVAALNNWNVATLNTFCDVGDYIYSSEFSSDGNLILTSSPSHPAQIWDSKTGKLLRNPGGDKHGADENIYRTAHFSPDGKYLIAWIDQHTAGLWETSTDKFVTALRGLDLISLGPPAEFSPDSKRLVAATENNTASVWDTDAGKIVAVLKGHAGQVLSAKFDLSGQRLVTFSNDGTARVWDTLTGKLISTLSGHEAAVNSAVFSPDGGYIITLTDQTGRLWRVDTAKLIAILKQPESTRFTPDNRAVATVSGDGTIRFWDVKNGRLLRAFTTSQKEVSDSLEDSTSTLEFSPDGHYIISCQKDNAVRLWNVGTGELVATSEGHHLAAFSSDGQLMATGAGNKFSDDGSVRIWNVKTGDLQVIAQGNKSPAHTLRFSADGQRIVTSSDDKIGRVWDTRSRSVVVSLRGNDKDVFNAAFSSDGKRVVTGSDDETARVWDAESGRLLATLNGSGFGYIDSAEFSPDGKLILTVSLKKPNDVRFDDTIALWDSESGKLLRDFTNPTKGVSSATFAPSGQSFVTEDDEGVKLWETSTGKLLKLFPGQADPSFGPSGKVLATVSKGNAYIWQTSSGRQLLAIHAPPGEDVGFNSAIFSPDEKSILTTGPEVNSWSSKNGAHISKFPAYARNTEFSSDGRYIVTTPPAVRHTIVYVLDVNSAKLIFELPDQEGASFSPDGQRVVSENLKASAEIRETQTGKLVATIRGHQGHLTGVKFSSDGTRLVSTGDEEKTARISTLLSPEAGPPPAWFADFLVYLGQRQLNSDGELVSIPPNEYLTIRDRLRKIVDHGTNQDTPYLRVLRHFFQE